MPLTGGIIVGASGGFFVLECPESGAPTFCRCALHLPPTAPTIGANPSKAGGRIPSAAHVAALLHPRGFAKVSWAIVGLVTVPMVDLRSRPPAVRKSEDSAGSRNGSA